MSTTENQIETAVGSYRKPVDPITFKIHSSLQSGDPVNSDVMTDYHAIDEAGKWSQVMMKARPKTQVDGMHPVNTTAVDTDGKRVAEIRTYRNQNRRESYVYKIYTKTDQFDWKTDAEEIGFVRASHDNIAVKKAAHEVSSYMMIHDDVQPTLFIAQIFYVMDHEGAKVAEIRVFSNRGFKAMREARGQ